jgi:hypothetical protein
MNSSHKLVHNVSAESPGVFNITPVEHSPQVTDPTKSEKIFRLACMQLDVINRYLKKGGHTLPTDPESVNKILEELQGINKQLWEESQISISKTFLI